MWVLAGLAVSFEWRTHTSRGHRELPVWRVMLFPGFPCLHRTACHTALHRTFGVSHGVTQLDPVDSLSPVWVTEASAFDSSDIGLICGHCLYAELLKLPLLCYPSK